MEAKRADVYIVTETHDGFRLNGDDAVLLSAAGKLPYKPIDRAAGIWTRWKPLSLKEFEPRDKRLSVCGAFECVLGRVIVYATILPHHADGESVGAKKWEWHRRAVDDQLADWSTLRAEFPEHHVIIAGDFNMAMCSGERYVDVESREKLLTGCKQIGLRCITGLDLRARVGRANIDHIMVSDRLREGEVEAWPGTTQVSGAPRILSDHNGIALTLAAAALT